MKKPSLLSHVLPLLALSACAYGPSDGEETDSAESALRAVGTYRVPVDDPALEASASVPLPRVDYRVRGTSVKLRYKMPTALVGIADQDVDLDGTLDRATGIATLSGPAGTAVCEPLDDGTTECHEVLSGLVVDPVAVGRLWTERGVTQDEIERRVEVATRFGGDPIGIVSFAGGPRRPR